MDNECIQLLVNKRARRFIVMNKMLESLQSDISITSKRSIVRYNGCNGKRTMHNSLWFLSTVITRCRKDKVLMRKDLPRSPWLLHWSMLQMPWSQSTSLHIYHSITYRISKMAKINSATRIALVTGDMRDCISVQFATVHWGAWMLYHLSRSLGFDGISCTDIPRELFRAEDITSHPEKGRLSWSCWRGETQRLWCGTGWFAFSTSSDGIVQWISAWRGDRILIDWFRV